MTDWTDEEYQEYQRKEAERIERELAAEEKARTAATPTTVDRAVFLSVRELMRTSTVQLPHEQHYFLAKSHIYATLAVAIAISTKNQTEGNSNDE